MGPLTSKSILEDVSSLADVATLLDSTPSQLRYLLYGRDEKVRYTKFLIAKRRGGERAIWAPKADLKSIQRRLAVFIQERITFAIPPHGFVQGRSIVTNARPHARHRMVFNVDLKDFFPTINFGRVRGIFLAMPFAASRPVATVLAQICCHKGSLPQGAPTSPIISNMICRKMDSELFKFARTHHCIYTRYADDLTFSRRTGVLPPEIVIEDADGNSLLGKELRSIIERNGFQPHPDKVRLSRNTNRQIVAGLIVNRGVNVPRKFVRDLRAMICDWRNRGLEAAQKTHHERYYRWSSRLRPKPRLDLMIAGKLSFLKMVKGVRDPVRVNLQRQLVGVWPDYLAVMQKENMELDMRDLFISHASEDKNDIVRPLVESLIREGVSVWYDEYEITIGDDLRTKIDEGLKKSYYGVVVLSPNFFNVKKTWTEREVNGLFALEDADKRQRILPLWHNLDQADVARKSPILAGKAAWKSSTFTPEQLAKKFNEFSEGTTPITAGRP